MVLFFGTITFFWNHNFLVASAASYGSFFWNYNFFWNHNFLVASAARHGSFLNYFFRIGIYTSFCFGITILFVASAASYGSLFLTIAFFGMIADVLQWQEAKYFSLQVKGLAFQTFVVCVV